MRALLDSSTVHLIRAARSLVQQAEADLADTIVRAGALAGRTQWQSRASDGYRAGLDDLLAELRFVAARADAAQHALAAAERRELAQQWSAG